MIRAMLIDDEQPALDELEYQLHRYDCIEIVSMLQDPRRVLENVMKIRPDVVFLDIDMPGENGLELALKIQELHFGIIIVFVTAYSEYALDAFQAFPLDYLLKPIDEKRLDRTMEHLVQAANEKENSGQTGSTVVHCFRNFEAFHETYSKIPIKFPTRQTKELFAYLICHYGQTIPREELILNIFGGKSDKKSLNLLYVTVYNLRRALEDAKIGRNIIKITGSYRLEVSDGVCDYVDFSKFVETNSFLDDSNIAAAERAAKLYAGAYLQNEDYFWVDEVRTKLELQYETLMLNIAEYYSELEELQKAEHFLITLIQYDPLSETGNRSLLELYMREGNREKFRRQYEIYEKILREELQTTPARQFVAFYQAISR